MRVEVAGDDEALRRVVTAELRRRGHEIADTRPEAVVMVPSASRAEQTRLTSLLGTDTGPGVVLASRVGCDLVPLPRYRRWLRLEQHLAASRRGWTLLRVTHHHDAVWKLLDRLARPPVMVVAHDTRLQPLDPEVIATRLVDAAEAEPLGWAGDLGGPTAYDLSDLARSYLAATGKRRPVLRVNSPGIAGAALRAGAVLTPNQDRRGRSWNDFVAEQMSG